MNEQPQLTGGPVSFSAPASTLGTLSLTQGAHADAWPSGLQEVAFQLNPMWAVMLDALPVSKVLEFLKKTMKRATLYSDWPFSVALLTLFPRDFTWCL